MIYDEIKLAAKKRGVSIYQIEKDLGLSNGSLSKWNKATPSALSLMKVANYLKVPVNSLLSNEKEELTK